MWSIFKLLVCVSVFRSDWNQFSPHLQNVAKLLKNAIVGKERWSVYCESAGKKGAERLIVALLFMGTQHSSFQRWSCWSNMWLLSQRGNTDQVVQWAKAGVVKSSSEKNPTSLGGTKYPCASLVTGSSCRPSSDVSRFVRLLMQMWKLILTRDLGFCQSFTENGKTGRFDLL